MRLAPIKDYFIKFVDRIAPHETCVINPVLDYLFHTCFYKLINTSICFALALGVTERLEGVLFWAIGLYFVQDLVSKASMEICFIICGWLDGLGAISGLVGQVSGRAVLWNIFWNFEVVYLIFLELILFDFVKFCKVLLGFHLLLGYIREHVEFLRYDRLLSHSWLCRFWPLLADRAVRQRAKNTPEGLLFRWAFHQRILKHFWTTTYILHCHKRLISQHCIWRAQHRLHGISWFQSILYANYIFVLFNLHFDEILHMQRRFHKWSHLARKARSSMCTSWTVLLQLHFMKLLIILLHLVFLIIRIFQYIDILILWAKVKSLGLLFLEFLVL